MLVWMTLMGGSAILLGGTLLAVRVDRRWRAAHLQCCRCLEVWFSRDKMCERCGARGHDYDWLAAKFAGFPTHDWQGYLTTGPMRRVVLPIRNSAPQLFGPTADRTSFVVPRARPTAPWSDPVGAGVAHRSRV